LCGHDNEGNQGFTYRQNHTSFRKAEDGVKFHDVNKIEEWNTVLICIMPHHGKVKEGS
jgi:hypothetical protein